ncbi:hypothetical protein Dimus_023664 [Dionaea muscipula]
MERSERKSGRENVEEPETRARRARISNGAQISLRIFVVVTSGISAYLMLTSNEETLVYDMPMSAKYSYSPAFKYSGCINIAASALGLISSITTLMVIRRRGNYYPASYFFFLFLHDLVMACLLVGGCAAATAIGYVGKHGFDEAGWVAICGHFSSFCNRITASVILAFASTFFFLSLTVISAINSTHIHHVSTAPQVDVEPPL